MPRGQYPRFKKVQPGQSGPTSARDAQGPSKPQTVEFDSPGPLHEDAELVREEFALPRGWAKGALLNVRNTGAEYRITLFPEEFDPQQPERCLRFANPAEAQNFVSQWYSRQSNDPRAMR
jgi:hypothetical protein